MAKYTNEDCHGYSDSSRESRTHNTIVSNETYIYFDKSSLDLILAVFERISKFVESAYSSNTKIVFYHLHNKNIIKKLLVLIDYLDRNRKVFQNIEIKENDAPIHDIKCELVSDEYSISSPINRKRLNSAGLSDNNILNMSIFKQWQEIETIKHEENKKDLIDNLGGRIISQTLNQQVKAENDKFELKQQRVRKEKTDSISKKSKDNVFERRETVESYNKETFKKAKRAVTGKVELIKKRLQELSCKNKDNNESAKVIKVGCSILN